MPQLHNFRVGFFPLHLLLTSKVMCLQDISASRVTLALSNLKAVILFSTSQPSKLNKESVIAKHQDCLLHCESLVCCQSLAKILHHYFISPNIIQSTFLQAAPCQQPVNTCRALVLAPSKPVSSLKFLSLNDSAPEPSHIEEHQSCSCFCYSKRQTSLSRVRRIAQSR